MKTINKSLCMALALCVLSACSSDPVTEDESDVIEAPQSTVQFEEDQALANEVLEVLNDYRVSEDLEPLRLLNDAEKLAEEHSLYMAEENEASHDNFVERAAYLQNRGAESVSENVAFGFQDAESVVEAWLQSDTHREAIEGDHTHTGIGVYRNENGHPFFTQMFVEM